MIKKKKWVIINLFVWMLIISSMTVYAQTSTSNNGDMVKIRDSEFEILIQEIQNIRNLNPEYTDDIIFIVMNERHPENSKERSIIDTWNILTDAEKKLCIRYPFDALKVNSARNIAISQTETKYGYNGLGDKSDAFRHGIWNAEMTVLIGKEKAELFATAHEDKDVTGNESDGYSKSAHREMDLHNNEIGRSIGENNKNASEDEMADIIFEAVNLQNSQLVRLHE